MEKHSAQVGRAASRNLEDMTDDFVILAEHWPDVQSLSLQNNIKTGKMSQNNVNALLSVLEGSGITITRGEQS